MKTLEELKKLDQKKLVEELQSLEKEYFTVNFEVKTGQAKNIHDVKKYRRQIARIKTIMGEKINSQELVNPTS